MQGNIFPGNLVLKYVRLSQIRVSRVKMTATNQTVLNWTTRNQAKACIIHSCNTLYKMQQHTYKTVCIDIPVQISVTKTVQKPL